MPDQDLFSFGTCCNTALSTINHYNVYSLIASTTGQAFASSRTDSRQLTGDCLPTVNGLIQCH